MIKTSIIKRLQNKKYRLYSRKKDKSGHRRNLGTFDSLDAAKKHEKDISFFKFKYHSDDGLTDDHITQMLDDLSNIGEYLERAGMVDKAQAIYDTMYLLDGDLADDFPNAQHNTENSAYVGGDGVAGGYSLLHTPMVGQPADDQNNLDGLAGVNGLWGNSVIDNGGAGQFNVLNDNFMYRSYDNDEGKYDHNRK